jgi:hypothetical protein
MHPLKIVKALAGLVDVKARRSRARNADSAPISKARREIKIGISGR